MSLWEWYHSNRDDIAPLLAPLGSALVGLGTVLVGGLVARAALRQAGTATEAARIANRHAEIAAVRHEEQMRADRQRRITDTFSKAVEQLASEKVEVRLGGIYTLERLAGEAPVSQRAGEEPPDPGTDAVSELYWTVMETLTAFVRERARWRDPFDEVRPLSEPATDIMAVLEVIRSRPNAGRQRETQRGWRLDLRKTDLSDANLNGSHLEDAILSGAHLEDAVLVGAHLEGVDLSSAHLEGANLNGSHLEDAILSGAHLEGASLTRAHLEGASLIEAHLEGVDLSATIGDAKTRLPEGVVRPTQWPAYKLD